ncbi:hypothetical protein U3516DRAFT_672526 [Neocallimastix sp. 'constans']
MNNMTCIDNLYTTNFCQPKSNYYSNNTKGNLIKNPNLNLNKNLVNNKNINYIENGINSNNENNLNIDNYYTNIINSNISDFNSNHHCNRDSNNTITDMNFCNINVNNYINSNFIPNNNINILDNSVINQDSINNNDFHIKNNNVISNINSINNIFINNNNDVCINEIYSNNIECNFNDVNISSEVTNKNENDMSDKCNNTNIYQINIDNKNMSNNQNNMISNINENINQNIFIGNIIDSNNINNEWINIEKNNLCNTNNHQTHIGSSMNKYDNIIEMEKLYTYFSNIISENNIIDNNDYNITENNLNNITNYEDKYHPIINDHINENELNISNFFNNGNNSPNKNYLSNIDINITKEALNDSDINIKNINEIPNDLNNKIVDPINKDITNNAINISQIDALTNLNINIKNYNEIPCESNIKIIDPTNKNITLNDIDSTQADSNIQSNTYYRKTNTILYDNKINDINFSRDNQINQIINITNKNGIQNNNIEINETNQVEKVSSNNNMILYSSLYSCAITSDIIKTKNDYEKCSSDNNINHTNNSYNNSKKNNLCIKNITDNSTTDFNNINSIIKSEYSLFNSINNENKNIKSDKNHIRRKAKTRSYHNKSTKNSSILINKKSNNDYSLKLILNNYINLDNPKELENNDLIEREKNKITISLRNYSSYYLTEDKKWIIDSITQLLQTIKFELSNLQHFPNKKLRLKIISRNQSNFSFDNFYYESKENLIQLKFKYVYLKGRQARIFEIYVFILQLLLNNLKEKIIVKKRDIYYRNVSLFKSQKTVDNIASQKGLISGNIIIKFKKGYTLYYNKNFFYLYIKFFFNILISILNKILHIQIFGEIILVIEKETIFQYLYSSGFLEKNKNIILITGKGYPDLCTRLFLRYIIDKNDENEYKQNFNNENLFTSLTNINSSEALIKKGKKLKIFGLFDFDPYGHEIFLVYQKGSKSLEYYTNQLSIPEIKCLGLNYNDLLNYNILNSQLLSLTPNDRKKCLSIIKKFYNNNKYKKTIEKMLFTNYKAEIESLSTGIDNNSFHQYIINQLYQR